MAADVVLAVVETDLRLLAAEAKKAEGPMTNLMGMLHHSDLPAVKDATERALQKVRSVEHGGLSSVQQALEILSPFSLACETKYAKLACIAISSFQKLLANDAVSIRGRCEIIKALQAAERLNDESVKLRILQASLTIIQSPSFADEQDAIQQLLSLTFRVYVNNKSNFAVHSTAAATIRQAVALVFDHSLLPSQAPAAPTTFSGSPAVGSSPQPSLPTPIRSITSSGGANSPGPPHPVAAAPGGGGPLAAAPASATATAAAIAGVIASIPATAEGGPAPGREVVPVLLLEEMMGWLGARDGKELGWVQLQQRGGSRVDRTFLLEMLEAVLLQRSAAIHRLPGLVQCVKTKVAPAINGLLDSACDRLVDPNDAVDCRLVVRCAAALVRRHHDLAPERAAAMVVRLAETAGSVGRPGAAHRWQRFMALQVLRSLLADPSLLYRLHHMAPPPPPDKQSSAAGSTTAAGKAVGATGAGEAANGDAASDSAGGGTGAGGGGVLPAVVQFLHDALRWYVRTAIETPEDDVVAALGNLYLQRAMGARDAVQETEAFGTNLAQGSEVVIAHLALECVLAMVAATEALTDVVVVPAEPGMPSPKLIARDTPDVRCAAVAGLVSELWRCVLGVCNTLLARAGHEVLVGLLVRGLQGITYSAGALSVIDARDALLHALCAHTLLPPGEDDVAALAVSTAGGAGVGGGPLVDDRSVGGSVRRLAVTTATAAPTASGSSAAAGGGGGGSTGSAGATAAGAGSGSPPAPGFLTALLVERSASSVRVVLTPRNIAALRSLFNLAHRLADGLGSCGWLYVVDAVNALDRILASPHTTTATFLLETGGEGEIVVGLQPMGSAVTPGAGQGAAGAAVGGGAAGAGGSAAAAAAAAGDGGLDDSSTTAQRELRILASAADQLFENSHHMSPEAVVSLLSALADISHRTLSGLGLLAGGGTAAAATATAAAVAAPPSLLPTAGSTVSASSVTSAAAAAAAATASAGAGGAGGALSPVAAAAAAPGPVRLCALNRMVDTLLHNLWRVQDLWGIFLAHVLEVLASSNVQVRAAAVDSLDRTITGALNPDLHVPDKFTAPLPALEDAFLPAYTAAGPSRRALMPSFPSYGQSPGGVTAAVPAAAAAVSPGGASVAAGSPGSRRTSRDAGFGASTTAAGMMMAVVTTPVSSPQLPVHPSTGRRVSGGSGYTAYGAPVVTSTTTAASPLPPPLPGRRVSGSGGSARASSDFSSLHPPLPPGLLHPPPPSLISSPAVNSASAPAAGTSTSPFANSLTAATAATTTANRIIANRGVQQSAQREDVQHMLLVALDSLYREGGRSPDVRHGLLRIALHVLQHHGDGLTRGWVPLLRLLDAVPRSGQGPADVRLGFQVVELLATDYLSSSLPKEHVAKALDVIAKFATQDTVLNVSLSAITMLWNVTDHLARSRGTFSKAAAAHQPHQHSQQHRKHLDQQHQQPQSTAATAPAAASAPSVAVAVPPSPVGPFGGSSLFGSDTTAGGEKQMSPAFAAALSFARGVPSLPSASSPDRSPWAQLQPPHPPQSSQSSQTQGQSQQPHQQQRGVQQPVGAAGGGSGQAAAVAPAAGGGSYPLHDLDEAESIAMLMIAFRSLKALSVDPRPEARNAAVRTLFLAVGSHGGKFPAATWHELFWSLLFDLLLTIHRVSASSSVEEAAAVELGKEKGGRPVVMLVHHSRNSEQKQWDETLVLALGGAAKVVRSYVGVLSGLDVWAQAWEQLMLLLGELLSTGRKALCLASTSLLTTVLQTHGSGPLVSKTMWQQTLAALDRGVNAMAAPNTSTPLQARAELLTCITTLSSQLLLLRCPRPAATGTPTATAAASNGDGGGSATSANGDGGGASAAAASSDPEQLLLILRWLDRFARYPVGSDDTSSIHFTTIGPVQKAVLAALAALPPAAATAGVWPAVLNVVCNMLRPFSTLALRQYAQQAAALQQQRKTSYPALGCSSTSIADGPATTTATAGAATVTQPPTTTTTTTAAAAAAAAAAPTGALASALDPMTSHSSAATAITATATSSSSREASVHNPTAAAGTAAGTAAGAAGTLGAGSISISSSSSPWLTFAATGEVMEARAMSPLWMARLVELLAGWYRDHVTWQVRVVTFPLLVGAMSECMACRHLLPLPQSNVTPTQYQQQQQQQLPTPQLQLYLGGDSGEVQALEELWRAAARGFMTVVQSGLPSINICSHQGQGQGQQQVLVPHSTWPALARAFQMFFLAANLPPLLQPPSEVQHALLLTTAAAGGSCGATAAYFRRMSASAEPPPPPSAATAAAAATPPPPAPSLEQVAADLEITTAVLDCLSETVLSSCQHAPLEMRRALIEVLDMGAASTAAPSAAGITSTDRPYDESCLPPTSRLSHVCLNKLYVLCSRGQDAPVPEPDGRDLGHQPVPAARSQLEVAHLALPVFVTRCEAILHDYARAEQRARPATSAPSCTFTAATADSSVVSSGSSAGAADAGGGGGADGQTALLTLATASSRAVTAAAMPVALPDKTLHVLELLQQLRVVQPVSDSLLPSRPHLRFWLDVMRAVRSNAAMPPPSLAAGAAAAAAGAAAALHSVSSLGGSGGGLGPGSVLQSPPAVSRRNSNGVDLVSPAAAASGGIAPGSAAGSELSFSSLALATGRSTPSSSSFFSRTYSSTGALLSSAMGMATGSSGGGGNSAVFAVPVTPPKRPSVGDSAGGAAAGQLGEPRTSAFMAPRIMTTVFATSGPGSVSGAGTGGGLQLTWKSLYVKEQPHLPALYGVLCECIGSSDPVVRAAVQGMLTALGGGLGLCAAAPLPQPPFL